MKKSLIGFSIGAAVISVLVIIFLATGSWKYFIHHEEEEEIRTRVVTPREAGSYSVVDYIEQTAWHENFNLKVPLEDGEMLITVFNKENEEDLAEEQFAAYRVISETAGPVYVTCIKFDEGSRRYKRMWNAPTAAARPETVSLFSQDLIGDRNNCIIVTGMNARNEHTMTIFKRSLYQSQNQAYIKIAELQIDGSIVIQETVRPYSYQQGISRGQSFNIAAYGHDDSSNNILDQIETVYSYNPMNEQYERLRVSRIPGSQIEQRRLRELLSGVPGVFENFITDLWYYVSPQGTIDARQYLYFDPSGKEIIFFGDEAQQVFHWQSSTPTRYGLYVRSQNISISTLLRFIDIELESLDSIRLRVIEDVRLKITVNTSWDGSYRRAGAANPKEPISRVKPSVDALYDSSWGRIQFHSTGEYTISSSGNVRGGRYVFFTVEGQELVELRPVTQRLDSSGAQINETAENRTVYRIENVAGTVIFSRVRLGTAGIQDMLEPPITLTPVAN